MSSPTIATCASLLILTACAQEPRHLTIRGDDAAPLPSATTIPTREVRCLKTAASGALHASVHHLTGGYPTNKFWSVEWTPSQLSFTKDMEPAKLDPATAQRLVNDVVSIVEDKSKDEGKYKTVTATLRWRCDDGPEGHAEYWAVESAPDAPPWTHVERVERAFGSAAP